MTRTRDRITKAANEQGLVIELLEWEPIRYGSEMGGAGGGWSCEFLNGGHVLAYNADELIENIRRFAATIEGVQS